LPGFDRVVVADWSAAGQPSPARPSADAIWIGQVAADGEALRYCRTRAEAGGVLADLLDAAQRAGQRVLLGFDFPLGYPAGFATRLTGQARAAAVWAWLAGQIRDGADNRNNRFEVAAGINRAMGAGAVGEGPGGPFWGRPAGLDLPDLPARKTVDYARLGLTERRGVEQAVPRAQPVWKLYTTGSVGSQALMGLPLVHRLAARAGVAVWPFDAAAAAAPVVLAEVYPSLLDPLVAQAGGIKDAAQVRLLARALWRLGQAGRLGGLFAGAGAGASEEGWILGAGQGSALMAAAGDG
jgi:molybdopterin-guanine dinucleotide biosynthesis protein B